MRRLERDGFANILTATRDHLDLRDQAAVNYWFRANRPRYVYLVAGTVGGIWANSHRPAEFIYDNLMMHCTVVHASHVFGVDKLLYLGSSCIYPRLAPQPMTEDSLLTGPLEPTNEPYAIAKIAGIKLCDAYRRQYGSDFISAMPTNLYGLNDNFDLQSSHVLPALMRKVHEAKARGVDTVEVWGTGSRDARVPVRRRPRRRLRLPHGPLRRRPARQRRHRRRGLHPGARGDARRRHPSGRRAPLGHLEAGRRAAQAARRVADAQLGWEAPTSLADGIRRTYEWFEANYDVARGIVRPVRGSDGACDAQVVQRDLRSPEDPHGVGEHAAARPD